MKIWIDKIYVNVYSKSKLNEFKLDLFERLKSSKKIKENIYIKENDILWLESEETEWLMIPRLPKFELKVQFKEMDENNQIAIIRVTGNTMLWLFKYLTIIVAIILIAFFSFEQVIEINELGFNVLIFIIGPIATCFFCNYSNRSNMRNALVEIQSLVSKEKYFIRIEGN